MTRLNKYKGVIRIGVLGGIGPESTAEFYTKLITQYQKRGLIKSNKDFPQIIINSIPAPELIYDKITSEDLVQYVEGLKQLDSFGVDFIVMVCNTIHLFYETLQEKIKTPILDLRVEVRRVLQKRGVRSVLILGTPSTIENGLYEFDDLKTVKPTKREVEFLSRAIFDFNSGIDKELESKKVSKMCSAYLDGGKAETVILGCTEFGLMLSDAPFDKINTIDVLIDATINRSESLK